MELGEAIADGVQKGKLARVRDLVQQGVAAGTSPQAVLDGLLAGMSAVGQKFRANEVYIPEVLIAARAMNAGIALLRPLLAAGPGLLVRGRVVIGTVRGDLHDLGKNLVKTMMEARGLEVVDLGVDVPAARFAQVAREKRADIVACSALLTTTMPEMAKVMEALAAAGLRGKVRTMVGGAPIHDAYARQVGADGWAPNAVAAADVALSFLPRRPN